MTRLRIIWYVQPVSSYGDGLVVGRVGTEPLAALPVIAAAENAREVHRVGIHRRAAAPAATASSACAAASSTTTAASAGRAGVARRCRRRAVEGPDASGERVSA